MKRLDKPLLARLYAEQGLTVDMLPHTVEELQLQKLYNRAVGYKDRATLRELYVGLMTLRKSGNLSSKPRKRGPLEETNNVLSFD